VLAGDDTAAADLEVGTPPGAHLVTAQFAGPSGDLRNLVDRVGEPLGRLTGSDLGTSFPSARLGLLAMLPLEPFGAPVGGLAHTQQGRPGSLRPPGSRINAVGRVPGPACTPGAWWLIENLCGPLSDCGEVARLD
jgi:hypothetical protein